MLYQWYQQIIVFQAVCLTSANACFSSDPSTSFAGNYRNRNKGNSSDNQNEIQIDYHGGGYGFIIDHVYFVFDSSDSVSFDSWLMNFYYSEFMNELDRALQLLTTDSESDSSLFI